MAKQAQATISDDAESPLGRPRKATPMADGAPVEKPAVALVADDAPMEEPKRRRPPVAKPIRKPKSKPKSKAAPEVLALVETEEDSGQYETEEIGTLTELLDVMDENRKVFVTRNWREF